MVAATYAAPPGDPILVLCVVAPTMAALPRRRHFVSGMLAATLAGLTGWRRFVFVVLMATLASSPANVELGVLAGTWEAGPGAVLSWGYWRRGWRRFLPGMVLSNGCCRL